MNEELMTYLDAIDALQNGLCVARKGWNWQNLFVCKQVESTIDKDIIPKMQSLPKSAKNILGIYDIHPITYKNQMLIINLITKEINSWVASSSDTFANDWFIYEVK